MPVCLLIYWRILTYLDDGWKLNQEKCIHVSRFIHNGGWLLTPSQLASIRCQYLNTRNLPQACISLAVLLDMTCFPDTPNRAGLGKPRWAFPLQSEYRNELGAHEESETNALVRSRSVRGLVLHPRSHASAPLPSLQSTRLSWIFARAVYEMLLARLSSKIEPMDVRLIINYPLVACCQETSYSASISLEKQR